MDNTTSNNIVSVDNLQVDRNTKRIHSKQRETIPAEATHFSIDQRVLAFQSAWLYYKQNEGKFGEPIPDKFNLHKDNPNVILIRDGNIFDLNNLHESLRFAPIESIKVDSRGRIVKGYFKVEPSESDKANAWKNKHLNVNERIIAQGLGNTYHKRNVKPI
jgi:hypothetical protein